MYIQTNVYVYASGRWNYVCARVGHWHRIAPTCSLHLTHINCPKVSRKSWKKSSYRIVSDSSRSHDQNRCLRSTFNRRLTSTYYQKCIRRFFLKPRLRVSALYEETEAAKPQQRPTTLLSYTPAYLAHSARSLCNLHCFITTFGNWWNSRFEKTIFFPWLFGIRMFAFTVTEEVI